MVTLLGHVFRQFGPPPAANTRVGRKVVIDEQNVHGVG